jgi:hypothetical protein
VPPTTAPDLIGQRFGQLVVLSRAPANTNATKRAHWLCRCDCGTEIVKLGKYLLCGDTSSCGCAQRAMRERGNVKHGGIIGGHKMREYGIWRSMKSRCYVRSSSNFKFYGAVGVTICEQWREDFPAFLRDMGPCPQNYSIDRIDPNGNYEPSNCRWASWAVQHVNTRRHHAASSKSESSTRI